MGFFNLHKPLVYKYKPIYYDPKKEAQKERMKAAGDSSKAEEDGTYRPSIKRGTFREMSNKMGGSKHEELRKSNIRLLIILSVLLIIAYFLLK